MPSFIKKIRFIFLCILAPLFSVLLGAEFCIRLFSSSGYITPKILRERSFQTVPAVFARSVLPEMAQTVRASSHTVANINARGYRGKNFAVPKPEGTLRILIYGGSSVFDIYASEGNDWPHLVEKKLRSLGVSNAEIINAGILGHSSADAFGRFFAEGHLFDPDYVVMYAAWNDMKYFARNESLLRLFKPTQGHPLYYYQGFLDQFLCEHSQLYVRLRYRYILSKNRMTLEGNSPGAHSSVISANALRQYRLTLETFVDMVRNAHAKPVLALEAHLLVPHNTTADYAAINFESQELTPQALLQATEMAESITRAVAKSKHAALIDASSMMSGKRDYFADHVHTSPAGSHKLAEIMADALYQIILAEQPHKAVAH